MAVMRWYLFCKAKHSTRTRPNLKSNLAINGYAKRTHPPCSQMIQGSSLLLFAGAVKEPFCFSNAQKNNVSFGCPARLTGMLPAKLLVKGTVTFGKESLTSKSVQNRLNLAYEMVHGSGSGNSAYNLANED